MFRSRTSNGSKESQFFRIGVLLILMPTLAAAQTVLIDDFNDGNDDGWSYRDPSESEPYGPGIFDASSTEYQISSTGLVEHTRGAGNITATWEESADPMYSDGLLRTRFRIDENATSLALHMRLTNNDGLFDLYSFGAAAFDRGFPNPQGPNPGGVFFFDRFNATDTSNRVTKSQLIPEDRLRLGEDWMLEAGVIDDTVSMKWWPADGTEPSEPQWQWVDRRPLDTGTFGARVYISPGGIGATGVEPPFRIGATFDDLYFTLPLIGDFNHDGTLGTEDIDLLSEAIRESSEDWTFDVTGDGVLDTNDHEHWVTSSDIAGTFFGDANLDGEVLFEDFLALSAGFGAEGGWAEGDFDGNGHVEFPDFLRLSENFGRSSAVAASVPEPSPTMLLIVGLACWRFSQRRVRQP